MVALGLRAWGGFRNLIYLHKNRRTIHLQLKLELHYIGEIDKKKKQNSCMNYCILYY